MLVDAVAGANRCRTVLDNRFGCMTIVGDESDLRVVELLATSLLLQGSRAMLSIGSQTSLSGVSRTRSYRQTFLVAYASRIGERLEKNLPPAGAETCVDQQRRRVGSRDGGGRPGAARRA
jgi:hypothetical protein